MAAFAISKVSELKVLNTVYIVILVLWLTKCCKDKKSCFDNEWLWRVLKSIGGIYYSCYNVGKILMNYHLLYSFKLNIQGKVIFP